MLKSLAKYLVKRDSHLALNIQQAEILANYALHFVEKKGMLPPVNPNEIYYSADEPGGYLPNEWEDGWYNPSDKTFYKNGDNE